MCWVFNYWQIRCQNLIGLFKKGNSQVRKNIAEYSSRKGMIQERKNISEYFLRKRKSLLVKILQNINQERKDL
jgi:hypothetical protein